MENVFEFYDSVKEQEVEWLWYPYIPYGKLTLLEGDPGEGKSTFMLHIAALITRGQDMPDGYKVEKAEYVIYQCNEDDVADTIKPRLKSAGADCSKVAYIIDDNSSLTLNDQRITQALEKTHARLLILDPFQSFLIQDGDLHSVGRMRTTLGNLAVIASRYRCAVVLIGHMNKSATGKSLYRGLGSIDIAAIARSVLMVTRDEDDPEIRYMIPIKSSLAPEGPEVAFRMNRTIGFQWLKNKNKNHKKHLKKSDVADILTNMLEYGELTSGVIIQKAGLKELTQACSAYKTPLNDGDAVITPAFNMANAKNIIHAVGPDFSYTPTAFKELFDAYYNSLCVLMENGLHSISFPLISSGIFGGNLPDPAGESTKQCCRAYNKFTSDYPDYEIEVKLCAFTQREMASAQNVFNKFIK